MNKLLIGLIVFTFLLGTSVLYYEYHNLPNQSESGDALMDLICSDKSEMKFCDSAVVQYGRDFEPTCYERPQHLIDKCEIHNLNRENKK